LTGRFAVKHTAVYDPSFGVAIWAMKCDFGLKAEKQSEI